MVLHEVGLSKLVSLSHTEWLGHKIIVTKTYPECNMSCLKYFSSINSVLTRILWIDTIVPHFTEKETETQTSCLTLLHPLS